MEQTKAMRTAWISCLIAALFPFYSFFQMNLFNVIGPLLVQTEHLTIFQVGLLSASFLYAQAAFLIIAGLLLDRYSIKNLILMAMLVLATCTLVFTLSHSIWVLFMARILTGVAQAFAILGCFQLIVRYFPADKNALLMGLIITIALFGGMCAQAPFLLIIDALGMHAAMLLNAWVGYGITLLLFILLRSPPTIALPATKNHAIFEQLASVITTIQNSLCGVYASIMSFPMLVLGAAWGATYLIDTHQFSALEATLTTLMIFIGMMIGTPIAGAWADFSSSYKKTILVMSPVLMVLVFLVIILINPMPLTILLILFFITGLLSGPQVLVYPLIVKNNDPSLAGLALGFASTLIILVGALAQTLMSGLAAIVGVDRAIFMLPIALLLCVPIALKIK